MEKINYLDQYNRNNLTEKPLEYYLEAFKKTDPHKISSRLGITYAPLRKEFTFVFLVRHISPAAQISRSTPLIRNTTFLAETPRHEFFFCGICSIPLYISRMGSLSPTGNFHPGSCTMTFFAEGASSGCLGSIRGGSRISRKQLSSWEEF